MIPTPSLTLLERRRAASQDELETIAWWHVLTPECQRRVRDDMVVGQVHAGELVCRTGA